MPTPKLDDSVLLQAVELYELHGRSYSAASKASGINVQTIRDRVKSAVKRGLTSFDPVPPGFEAVQVSAIDKASGAWIKMRPAPGEEFDLPAGHVVKGVSALVDEDGRTKMKWVKTKEGVLDPLQVAEWLKDSFKDFQSGHAPIPAPAVHKTSLLTLVPCNDWHINMLAWEREVGVNWDLKIAEEAIGTAIEQAIFQSPPAETAIVLGGGDLLHADNKEARTAASGHALDVDGRYQKGVETVNRLMVRTIDAALHHNSKVIVRLLPGNHDEHSTVAVTYFLLAWYRNEPRVVVDCDPSLFFYHRFGQVLIGATHGHTVKLKDMAMIMATRRAEDWGLSKHRYVHGFHIHHKEMHGWEEHGVVAEAHQAPIPQDAWHYGAGFLSGRSVQTISYHYRHGEISRARVAVVDA